MKKDTIFEKSTGVLLLMMALAYLFSVIVRMIWVWQFHGDVNFYWNDQLMINANDGYFFATGAKDLMSGFIGEDSQRLSPVNVSAGLVGLTAYAAKLLPFSFESIIFYLPMVISSLLVVPIILTGRMMGSTGLGFLAALVGSVAWSYYNRTMVGYYDTDMFSVLIQFSIFYAMLNVAYTKELKSIIVAGIFIFAYPYFYAKGMPIVYALFVMLVLYLVAEYMGLVKTKETKEFEKGSYFLYQVIILLGISMMMAIPIEIRLILFVVFFIVLLKVKIDIRMIMGATLLFFIAFLFFSNMFNAIIDALSNYLATGVKSEGLRFYNTVQTVSEAGKISFSGMANRISGSELGLIASLVGYIVLVIRHKPFIIALPLIGVGVLSLWAGLRFTIYAVPVAAISAVYLFYFIASFVTQNKYTKWTIVIIGVVALLYPNINHIIEYKVPTLLDKLEVKDLDKLKSISNTRDYTLSWWDYAYPIWYYSDTNTIIDGGKHNNDNFIISKIMQTSSQDLAANLSRLAVETYVNSNYSNITDTIFRNKKKNQLNPNLLLSELEKSSYELPAKSRDIYLYLPYSMLRIFPTVAVFGNLDLSTGKAERKVSFYSTIATKNEKGLLTFKNGIKFDTTRGVIIVGKQVKYVKNFVISQKTNTNKVAFRSTYYHGDGKYAVVFLNNHGTFFVMDIQTFNSAFVQMLILGKYDKNLFELVISSPYSKIYKLKK